MSAFTLYTHPHSRGVTVSWMFEECQEAYQAELLHFHKSMKEPAYLALNPAGKVPTLKHNNTLISETAAIVCYLADLFPEKQLAPSTSSELRGEYYKWIFIICNQFEPALTDKLYAHQITDEMRFSLGYPELEVLLEQVTQQLTNHQYVLGEQFTSVDILLTALLAWSGFYKNIISLNETLLAYVKRMTGRPAFVRAEQQNQEWAKQMGVLS